MVRFLEKLPAHQLAGAHKHAAPYSSQRAPRCGRAWAKSASYLTRAGDEITAFLNILHLSCRFGHRPEYHDRNGV